MYSMFFGIRPVFQHCLLQVMSQPIRPLSLAWSRNINTITLCNIQCCVLDSSTIGTYTFPSILIFSAGKTRWLNRNPVVVVIDHTSTLVPLEPAIVWQYILKSLESLSKEVSKLCTWLGTQIVYLIGYTNSVPDRVNNLFTRLGVCFVYPIGYHLNITLWHDLLLIRPVWELDMCTKSGTLHMYPIRNKNAYTRQVLNAQ